MDHADIWDTEAADRYDTPGVGMFAADVLGRTVERLRSLADGGRALEMAIGTGRVAVPLAAAGVPVAGIDPDALYEVISNSAGSSWMFANRVPHILAGDYTPLSAVNIFVKDLGIVLDSARALTFPLPLTSAAHQMYLATSASGLGGEDDSAVIKMFQKLTGIELPHARGRDD